MFVDLHHIVMWTSPAQCVGWDADKVVMSVGCHTYIIPDNTIYDTNQQSDVYQGFLLNLRLP